MKKIFSNSPIRVGDRVTVCGWETMTVFVKMVTYRSSEARWEILLDWGSHGTSKVFDCDEGKTWNRYNHLN